LCCASQRFVISLCKSLYQAFNHFVKHLIKVVFAHPLTRFTPRIKIKIATPETLDLSLRFLLCFAGLLIGAMRHFTLNKFHAYLDIYPQE
jgi:hypothetical protein